MGKRNHNAAVIYITESNHILLIHYNYAVCGKSGWTTPGGRIERGESDFDAASRETWEETGIDITNPSCEVIYEFERSKTAIYVVVGPRLRPNLSSEHTDYVYFPLDLIDDINLISYTRKSLDILFNSGVLC